MAGTLKSYFTNTRNLLYSFLFSVPLLLLYEVLILISQPDPQHAVRVSVDVWFKNVFSILGVNTVSITMLAALAAGLVILYRERGKLRELRFKFFLFMFAEALAYSVLVALVTQTLVSLMFNFQTAESVYQLSGIQKFALSLGAGLYEELFFRVILVSLFLVVFKRFFKGVKWASVASAVVLSAVLFSAMHYMGSMGDAFTLSSFLYRFIFGLILNGIYVWRGFGIAAWTHALYDIMVLIILS